jgi:hypothetical protein
VATFHSLSERAILALLNSSGLVAGDLYFSTDENNLYLACTNTDGGVGIALTGMIATGNIQLGFSGAQGPTGATGATGPQGPKGDPGSGSENNIATESGDYTAPITIQTILCSGTGAQQITLTTTGLASGSVYVVTVTGKGPVTVIPQTGLINGQANVQLLANDSASFCFDGTNFSIE